MNRLLELLRADDEDQECFTVLSLSHFEICEHGIHAPISDTTHVVRTRPQGTAPKLFLYFGKTLQHEASGRAIQRVSNLRGSHRWGSTEKEMHMICLHIESADRPGSGFADAADFLFDKCSKFTYQNLFPIFRTPDKVIGQFIGDVFGVLCIHTQHDDKCSSL